MNRLNQERRAHTNADRQRLAKIERAIASMIAAIEDGRYQPAMKARMEELESQKAAILVRLEASAPRPLDVNPNVAEVYRRKVARVTKCLDDPQTNQEASSAIRSLIGEIVLTPGAKRGEVYAMLRGELMSILDFASERSAGGTLRIAGITSAAGSPRNHPCRTACRSDSKPDPCVPPGPGYSPSPSSNDVTIVLPAVRTRLRWPDGHP
jgi:site-specific DNA recombinase